MSLNHAKNVGKFEHFLMGSNSYIDDGMNSGEKNRKRIKGRTQKLLAMLVGI